MLMITLPAMTQEKSIMDILESTAWQNVEEKDVYIVFKNDTLIKYSRDIFTGEKRVITDVFYLSDVLDEEFDNTKIGKNKNGKYLLSHSIRVKRLFSYEINTVNENELTLEITEMVFGGGQTSTYRAYSGKVE